MSKYVKLSDVDLLALREAVELKLASLKRGQKSASPAFLEVYTRSISDFMLLHSKLGSLFVEEV